jgi:serine/threonine-protein kinase
MKTISRYRILEPLGTCEMGTLVRAYDRSLDRMVALRLIPDEMGLSASLKARFFQETRAWARLRHPNLAAVYDLGEDEGQLFVAMELLDGEELTMLLADRRPVFLEDKLSLAIQICEGLHHAHQHGVVHRDVKPANVIVLRSGQVKIVSFGLAPILAGSDDEFTTEPRLIVGSFGHLAPEQARGQADHRSDVFGVGALLYELLTFRPAFAGDDPLDVLERVRAATPTSVREIDATLPGDLAGIVERALAKEPSDRFPDLAEMRAALEFVRRRFVDDPERLAAYARGQLNQLRELQAALAERVAQESVGAVLRAEPEVADPLPTRGRISRPTWPLPALAAGLVAVAGLGVLGILTVARPLPLPARSYAALPSLQAAPPPRVQEPIARAASRSAPRPRMVAESPRVPAAGPPAAPARELTELREMVRAAREAADAARQAHAELVRATAELRMAMIASAPAAPAGPAGEAAAPAVVATVPSTPAGPERPTPSPGTGSGWLAALRELVPDESARQGTAGPVDWEVRDVRHEVAEDGHHHWSYVLVVHNRSGAGLRFEREERSVQADGVETVITRRPLLSSDASLEIAVRDQASLRRDTGFPSHLVRGDLRVWHRLHGHDELGRPFRVDVRFRLDAPTERI